jgi:undecaprenyl-diphosphatase
MVFFSEGSKWLPVRLGLLAVFLFLVLRKSTRTPAVLAMLGWPLADAACNWMKYGLQLPRPSTELADAIVRVERLTSYGSASAHAATMMCVATVFLYFNRPAGFVWLAVALLTGYSRVYVGVHYPYQVLFGWALGAFVALVVVKTWVAAVRIRQARGPQDGSPAKGP